MKWIDKVLDDRNESAMAFFWQLIGPLFILCTFALAPENYFIFFAGVVGLFLSAKFRNAGFIASLIILAGVSAAEHVQIGSFQIWSLGLEVSYAMAFFITAQSAARHQTFVHSLFSQLDTRNSLANNLEEELSKTRNEVTQTQVQLQEKVNTLQKQLDEVVSEQSSLLVLNEVLRKTTASHMMKKETLAEELYQLQSRLSSELSEKELLKAKLADVNLSAHTQLLEELNAAQRDREHTHTLKETLERLHAYEQQRAHVASMQVSSLEIEKNQLDQRIVCLEEELAELRSETKRLMLEKDSFVQARSQLEAENTSIQANSAQIQSSLNDMREENERLKLEKESQDEEIRQIRSLLEEMKSEKEILEQKTQELSNQSEQLLKTEMLYKQLRAQFEEKNKILHQTRSELFKIDNAYQALQIEMSQLDCGVPNHLVQSLEKEILALQEENQDLQSIVTHLSTQELDVKKKSE